MRDRAQGHDAPGGAVPLGDFRIHPGRPLPEFQSGANRAFAASFGDQPEADHVAVLCDPASLPRLELVPVLRKIEATGAMLPRTWRVVDWPPSGRRLPAIVFGRPKGKRLMAALDQAVAPVGEEEILRNFLIPVVPTLRQLHTAGVVHGTLNPANLYYQDAAGRRLMLGECLSVAMAALQPAWCAPIEVAMASPWGRGQGLSADDAFALGVSIAFLALGQSPAGGRSDAEMLELRLGVGSYAALIGGKRIPVGLVELLRGLLSDDARVRWTIAEVEEWLSSRHMVTRQAPAAKRASRPFLFDDKPHVTARGLAHAFSRDPVAAAAAIRGAEFGGWTGRALGDEASAALLKLATTEPASDARNENRDAALAARVSIALDPLAPPRYKGVAATAEGFGTALAAAATTQGSLQTIAEAIVQGVPQFHLSTRMLQPPEQVALLKTFEHFRTRRDDRRLGSGIERLLYELNPTLHCLSPLIERDCVIAIGALLPALERHAGEDFGGAFPIDRHSAAFVVARMKTTRHDWIEDLSSTDETRRLVGLVRLLARLHAFSNAATPSLARWIARQAAPLLDKYHHRPTRKRLAEKLERAAGAGALGDIVAVVVDEELEVRDESGFAEARRAYDAVLGEIQRLAAEAERREGQVMRMAGQLAAGLATVAGGAALAASLALLG